jgi:ADP-L-glycero-D-manno-heptose 6-epimerase
MQHEPFIIVTGAAGMIGSGVVRHLNDLGHTDLILVDDLGKDSRWKNLVGKKFEKLISRHKILEWLLGKESEIGAIIHLGACSDTMETDGDFLLENNYRFSVALAEWALKFQKRFIYASSAATYGDGSQGFSDDENVLEALRPINMYAYSKHLVDLWMKRQGVLDKVVGLKYFNVFGPNEYHKEHMASMVMKMTHIAQKEGTIRLFKSNDPERFKDGEQCRDFIYLRDAVRMTCFFLESRLSGIYNIGMGEALSWRELAGHLFNALNQKPQITYIDMPEALNRQYQNYTCADMRKWKAMIPFSVTPVGSAVKEYVQEFLLKEGRW